MRAGLVDCGWRCGLEPGSRAGGGFGFLDFLRCWQGLWAGVHDGAKLVVVV